MDSLFFSFANTWVFPRKRLLFLLGSIPLFLGCGYHLEGSNPVLPEQAQTIAINPIQNQTFQAGLDTSLMVHLRQKLRNNSSVRLVTPSEADLLLEIKLTTLTKDQTSVAKEGQQSELTLSLTGSVSLENRKTRQTLWQTQTTAQSTIFYERQEQATGLTTFSINKGMEDVTLHFAEKVYEKIFVNF